MTRRIPLPVHIAERWSRVRSGDLTPVTPRDAATVILLRDGPEVFLLRRVRAMAFAPGAYVFPGGSVDPADGDPADAADAADAEPVDSDPADGDPVAIRGRWRQRPALSRSLAPTTAVVDLGVEPGRARAIVRAAVRETFEECGVKLRPEALKPWARWVTPELEPRRYDTFFFVAALPDGEEPDIGTGGESDDGAWFTPAAALDAARGGSALLLPPTAVTLGELATAGGMAAIWDARRSLRPLCPGIAERDGRLWLEIPEGVEYPL